MLKFTHNKIASAIADIDRVPDDETAFREWIKAERHLGYLDANARSDERIIYASGPYTFIHSIAVPLADLHASEPEDLLSWSANPFTSIASYVSGGGRDTMWIERGDRSRGSAALSQGVDLIFGRTFEGWPGADRDYFEVAQEYAHLTGIHWRPEHGAYCKYDHNGDLASYVNVTRSKSEGGVNLVTFAWPELEEYLAIGGFALVRMFDFTLLRYGHFTSWREGPEDIVRRSVGFLYRQKVQGDAAYTRGVQILMPRDAKTVGEEVSNRWSGRGAKEYVTFTAQDWRNGNRVAEISTDPAATTNYFEAKDNDLPFELSPAYFRPEVLSKYKTDREKYTVRERDISCRTAWHLKAYDVNDAGQVFAYICYLRNLPYSEQLHWKSFNEPPKVGISERALVNDFKGEFVSFQHPRMEILSVLRGWQSRRVDWWTLRDENLLDRANPPISSSKDEWADAFMDLSKLIVEGFETKALRRKLEEKKASFEEKDGTIVLLEKLLTALHPEGGAIRLEGLRSVQLIRSKAKGHSGSLEGQALANDAITQHGTFAEHFKSICEQVVGELLTIDERLGR